MLKLKANRRKLVSSLVTLAAKKYVFEEQNEISYNGTAFETTTNIMFLFVFVFSQSWWWSR